MTFTTIAEAAAAMRAGRTTAEALAGESLAAYDADNWRTNAFVSLDRDGAISAAKRVDRERASGAIRGPLAGIPISLKDLIDEAGAVTRAGSRVLDDRPADSDAEVVSRLRAAGAVIIGRTNLHEFALGTTSEDSAFGAVHHPWDTDRSPGGSSGGAAAAVATGIGLGAVGTDTGGLVRIPAALCGLVGLKPTFGEIPTDGVVPLSPSFDHVGPIARTVQDAAWLYQIMAGREAADVRSRPGTIRLARLGGYFAHPVAPEVRSAFERAMTTLQKAHLSIEAVTLADTERVLDAYVRVVLPEAAAWHGQYLDERRDRYTPIVGARIADGRTFSAVDYLDAKAFCGRLRASVDRALAGVDALVLPTLPIVAPAIGASNIVVDPADGSAIALRTIMLKHTQLFNMTGHPAVTIPIATTGLSVGLQLVGARHETPQLLEIAAVCERVLAEDAA